MFRCFPGCPVYGCAATRCEQHYIDQVLDQAVRFASGGAVEPPERDEPGWDANGAPVEVCDAAEA